MSTIIFGIRIFANDHAAQLSETTTVGLYNVESDLSGNAASGQKVVNVDDGTLFQLLDDATLPKSPKVLIASYDEAGQVTVKDSEEAVIASINGNAITMRDNLSNTYATADYAKVVADSQFRWVQNAVPSLSETWKDGMLIPNGISKLIRTIDIENGGNVATVNGCNVAVKNTSQFWNTIMNTLDISLVGKRVEIVLFIDATESVKWYGVYEKPTWNRMSYSIPLRGTWKKRNANITEEQNVTGSDETVVVPATFGRWDDSPAQAVRTVKQVTEYTSKTLGGYVANGSGSANISPDIKAWPIVYVPSYTVYYGSIGGTFEDGEEVTTPLGGVAYIANDNGVDTMTVFNLTGGAIQWNTTVMTGSKSGATANVSTRAEIDAADANLDYVIQLGLVDPGGLDGTQSPTNMFLHSIEGDNSGKVRPIEKIIHAKDLWYIVRLAKYFSDNLAADPDEPTTWVSIKAHDRTYAVDNWKCQGFLDTDGSLIDSSDDNPLADVFSYEARGAGLVKGTGTESDPEVVNVVTNEEDLYLLPSAGFKIVAGANDNSIIIQPIMYNRDIDKLSTFKVLPFRNLDLISSQDRFRSWFASDDTILGYGRDTWDYKADGVFRPSADDINVTWAINNDAGNVDNISDRKTDSWAGSVAYNLPLVGSPVGTHVLFGVEFEVPVEPWFAYDNIYFAGHAKLELTSTGYKNLRGSSILFRTRRFVGGYSNAVANEHILDVGDPLTPLQTIRNVPDFYYITDPATKERYFYFSVDTGNEFSGYENAEIAQSAIGYESLYKGAIFISAWESVTPSTSGTIAATIEEAALVFEKEVSLSEKLLTYFLGREYDNTWGGRVTAADLAQSPRRIYELICRMQDFGERGTMPSGGWGSGYSSEALIKTSGAGSFDDATLAATLDTYSAARQIISYKNGRTDMLKQSICHEFFLAGYIDNNGYECLRKIPTNDLDFEAPTDLITFADIRAANSTVDVQEPDPNNIFPEPFVRYNMNMATGEYESIIAVHNVTARNADGTPGSTDDGDLCFAANEAERLTKGWIEDPDDALDGDSGQQLWERCVKLYELSGIINDPASDLTDLQWANGNLENAKTIAKDYLFNWIDWMRLKKCRFTVNFLCAAGGGIVVHEWQEGHRFRLQLAHETNNVAVECIATRIAIDPNPPYNVEIEAFMLESEKLESEYNIQDTDDANIDQWQDVYDTVAESSGVTDEDIQDQT